MKSNNINSGSQDHRGDDDHDNRSDYVHVHLSVDVEQEEPEQEDVGVACDGDHGASDQEYDIGKIKCTKGSHDIDDEVVEEDAFNNTNNSSNNEHEMRAFLRVRGNIDAGSDASFFDDDDIYEEVEKTREAKNDQEPQSMMENTGNQPGTIMSTKVIQFVDEDEDEDEEGTNKDLQSAVTPTAPNVDTTTTATTSTGIPVNLYDLNSSTSDLGYDNTTYPYNNSPPRLSTRLSSFFSVVSSATSNKQLHKERQTHHNQRHQLRQHLSKRLSSFFYNDASFAESVQHFNHQKSQKATFKSQRALLIRHLTRKNISSIDPYDGDDGADPDDPDDEEWALANDTAFKRRMRDFQFARRKRREKYGDASPWGILGLYDHLTGIRTDIEWAMDAAYRRDFELPYLSWQDFEDSKDTGYNKPFFSYFIIIVCTICLIVSIALNGWKVQPLNENPMIGPSAEVLVRMGAKYTPNIVYDGEWYRIFTAMFLHAGVIHWMMNMLAIYFLGPAIEQSHGFFATVLIFTLAGIGGNLLSAIFLAKSISVGASGGIFGLIGACLADIISNWGLLFSECVDDDDDYGDEKKNRRSVCQNINILLWLAFDIFINIVIGLTPLIDNFTHLGGMFFGFLCGLSTMKRVSHEFFGMEKHWLLRLRTFLVRFVGVIFTVVCILTAASTLASLGNGEIYTCWGCAYISCAPFPFWVEDESKWWTCDV
eukprot:CAMPEP_0203663092 /NCGR_PEP_ID=MMETSP0090-20130426/818_1 /ASSEMBLY_ACC=CAM_ASM_001088 /TAXON_ID=426623 /ORGANISM="Chaetoceros affinis, Strain CCMP159" /LENGTH=707 /DNA_ID=CAMNT_0050525959 /DNA_START=46 /DNA_END=2169 /DNA_ORIENTATION=-